MAKVEPTAIHYRGGAPAITDLLGGQVSAIFITAGVVIQHVQGRQAVADRHHLGQASAPACPTCRP